MPSGGCQKQLLLGRWLYSFLRAGGGLYKLTYAPGAAYKRLDGVIGYERWAGRFEHAWGLTEAAVYPSGAAI